MDATVRRRPPLFLIVIAAVHLLSASILAALKTETEIIQYRALEGSSSVIIKCNLTKSSPEDAIQLIFWYKGESNKPIYSVDARNISNLKHFNYYSRKGQSSGTSSQQADLASRISLTPDFSLCLERLSIEDSGLYRCRVDFRYSRTLNTIAKLNVIVPPKSIKIQTEHEVTLNSSYTEPVDEHSDLILRCIVTGASPPPKLTWLYADSMDPILENEYLLTARAIQAYHDAANNRTRMHSTPHQTRWPVDKYTITQLPSPISNSSNTSDNHLRSISVLHVRNLTREDVDRKLACRAKNSNLTSPLTKQVSINMNLRPLYVQILSVQRPLSAEKSTSLVCQSGGSRPKAQISWYLNGVALKSFREQYSSESNVTTSELLFQANAENSGSILACKARNERFSSEELSVQWTLNVFYKPKVQLLVQTNENGQPEWVSHAQIAESSEVIFQCRIKSNPPVIQTGWIFKNKPLINDARNGIIIQNSTLIIKKARRSHSGKFSCFAINIEGKNYSNSIEVDVLHTPYCLAGQQQIYGAAPGETIAISCVVVSKLPNKQRISPKQLAPSRSPAVRFSWRLNDTQLPPSIYSRGQLLLQHSSPTTGSAPSAPGRASSASSFNNADSYARFASNYGISGGAGAAESRNDDQPANKYHHQSHPNPLANRKTGKPEGWSKAKHKRSDLVADSSAGSSSGSSTVHSGTNKPNATESNVDIRKKADSVNRSDLGRKEEARRSDTNRSSDGGVDRGIVGDVDRSVDGTADRDTGKKTELNEKHSTDQHSVTSNETANVNKQRIKRTAGVHTAGSDLNTDSIRSDSIQTDESENLNHQNQSASYQAYLSMMSDVERPLNDFALSPTKQLRSANLFTKDKKHYPNYYLDHAANSGGNQNNHYPNNQQPAFNHQNASDLYVSKLNLDTKIYSFGFVECWAENEIGVQEEPCVFSVIPAGPPETLRDCRILNETWYSLNVKCKSGFDGGFKQIFHLIAYETELISHFGLNSPNGKILSNNGLGKNQRNFVLNLTNSEQPEFYLNQLKSGVSYLLLIYAVNEKGSSPFFTLIGQTVAMLRQTIPNDNEQLIRIDAYVAIGTGICFTIFLISLIIVLIIRIRNKADTKKQNLDQLDQYGSNNDLNGCEDLMMMNGTGSSTLKTTKKRGSKTDTLVKQTFDKDEAISDKLFDSEKFGETHHHHFHPHHHFDEQFIDTSDLEMPKEQDLMPNLDQGPTNIYLLDFQTKLINCDTSFALNAPHLTLQNSDYNTEIYPSSETTIAFSTPV